MDNNNTNWPDSWSQLTEAGKTAVFAWPQTSKYGNRSISISNPTGWAVVSSDYISATTDDKFIVSGYIKTTDATGYALIKVDFYSAPDQWIDQTVSYGLKGTHDWTRVQAVIESIPAGTTLIRVSAGMDPGTGTAYFDGMQLERGTVLSAYNLIDNSSFERIAENNLPVNWTRNNLTTSDTLDYSEHHVGLVSYKITGQADASKSISQRINLSGDKNTRLTLSGWSRQTGASAAGGYFTQLAIHYTPNEGENWIGWQGNDFSLAEEGWQHVAAVIEPDDVFDWIEVYYQYSNQSGAAWFDAARLEIGPSHTSYTYDTEGNYVASVTDPMGNTAGFTYDAFGNILNSKDPKKQTTAFAYDTRNLLTQVTDAKNGVTTYGYDNAGNRTTVTDAGNRMTTYEYNEFNQVSKITNPLNQIIQFGYNKNGQNVKTVFPKGDIITSSYNALNRLDGVFYNGVQKWGYTYDANGNVTAVNNIAAGISTTNIYDKNDRIVNVQEGPSNQFDYGYDGNSNLISLTLTAATTSHQYSYAYDSLDQMTA
ncbi:MAG TPA: hypothetical protein VM577_06005, partial [Anaerovoracaceae bacterium]|nr:hypothetical protein [Anaerovoracaceae bacterium]